MSRIKPKRSNVAAKVPTTSDLEVGEIAVNMADQKIFVHEPGGTIVELGQQPDLTGYATEAYVTAQGYLTTHQDISGKADTTYVDAQVALKADAATTYTKTEVDNAIAASAPTGYNNANWDTAYGWGDHSTEGYLTTHQDISGKADVGVSYTKAEADALLGDKADAADNATQTWVAAQNYLTSETPETVTSLGLAANILKYTDENGVETDLDLSLYLDDTNLARIVSGTLDNVTSIATFTRDDASTFTIDLSNLAQDLSPYSTTVEMNTAISTATADGNTAFAWGDHSTEGYLTTHQDISGKADTTYVDAQLALKADAADNATQTWVNAQGYLTTHQSLAGYATEAYADQAEADALAAANAYTTTQIGNLSIPAAYSNNDVDNHLNSTALDSGDLLGWNGTDYEWAGVGDYIAAAGLAQNYNGGGSDTQYSSFVLDGGASTEPSEANGLDGGNSSSGVAVTVSFADLTSTPTTLAGYGISDAYTKAEVDGLIVASGGYNDGAVDIHINQSTATSNQLLSWDGADYAWVDQGTTDLTGYATETYVTTEISNLVASAPAALDTLNELAAALGDDPNFATTVNNNIATKLSLAGGTMTGNLTVAGVTETITDHGNISGSYVVDAEAASTHKLTLNGAATFEGFSNPAAGQGVTLIVNQDGAGNRLWNTANITIKYADGASTLTTSANATDFVTLFYDGTTYYASFAVGYV